MLAPVYLENKFFWGLPIHWGGGILEIKFNKNDALLVVDIQYDFLPGGALGVPLGDQVIPPIKDLIMAATKGHATIIASRDWHPANHISFHEQGGPWPPHCVQNTPGAKFHESLQYPKDTIIVSKATNSDKDVYSAFHAETEKGVPLPKILEEHNIKRIIICGLCLDYCVKASSLDLIKEGYETLVVLNATKAINEEDGLETIRLLTSFGVQFV